MYDNFKLPDGSQWTRVGVRRANKGFKFVNSELKTIELISGCSPNDIYEAYLSKSGDLLAVVTWDSRHNYVGGSLYRTSDGAEMSECFVQDESADEFFRLSVANMVKHMTHMVHQFHP